MNADLTLTAYDKQTEYLCKVFVLPSDLLGYARDDRSGHQGLPPTPGIAGSRGRRYGRRIRTSC